MKINSFLTDILNVFISTGYISLYHTHIHKVKKVGVKNMNAKEEYKVRLEMSKMHEEFIERMSNSYDNNYYVESVWYCYAIFEQRISRLISKYIDKCPLPDRNTTV